MLKYTSARNYDAPLSDNLYEGDHQEETNFCIGAEMAAKLIATARAGDVDNARKLIENGVSVDSTGEQNWTALHHAAER